MMNRNVKKALETMALAMTITGASLAWAAPSGAAAESAKKQADASRAKATQLKEEAGKLAGEAQAAANAASAAIGALAAAQDKLSTANAGGDPAAVKAAQEEVTGLTLAARRATDALEGRRNEARYLAADPNEVGVKKMAESAAAEYDALLAAKKTAAAAWAGYARAAGDANTTPAAALEAKNAALDADAAVQIADFTFKANSSLNAKSDAALKRGQQAVIDKLAEVKKLNGQIADTMKAIAAEQSKIRKLQLQVSAAQAAADDAAKAAPKAK